MGPFVNAVTTSVEIGADDLYRSHLPESLSEATEKNFVFPYSDSNDFVIMKLCFNPHIGRLFHS